MKIFLICPAEHPEVSALAETAPLVNLCILGNPFIYYWLEHLAGCGAKEITLLVADRPEQVRTLVGDGSRWGLRLEILPQSHELTIAEARGKFASDTAASDKFLLIDHFPNFPEAKLFSSYAGFYSATQTWFSECRNRLQLGVKEISPGIWAGLRTHISPRAKLHAPCWLGENVLVKSDAEIGPMAILENGVAVERGASIQQSWIAPQTFVGSLTQIKESFALGNVLVNFRTDSVTKIPDPYLLCALRDRNTSVSSGNLFGRIAALLALLLTLPFALITIGKAKLLGLRALRPRRATAPQIGGENISSITYFEFTNVTGWWKRWPQLWNVVRGEFAWIGNRPLTAMEAGKLTNEFERLWLNTPIGLISQGDAEGCTNLYSDEARAHASFYAVSVNWRLDLSILIRALTRLLSGKYTAPIPNQSGAFKERSLPLAVR